MTDSDGITPSQEPEEALVDTGDGTLENTVMGLIDALDGLAARVEALEAGEDSASTPFGEWLPWLIRTYALDEEITKEWKQVPGVPEELAALHAAWLTAYKDDGAPKKGSTAMHWHEGLERARSRINALYGHHRRRRTTARPGAA